MADFGEIKSVEIGNDLDAEKKKYICDVEFEDSDDVRSVQIINMSGVNCRPREGQKILVINLGGGFELGIATDDGIDADLEDGEFEIYSIDGDGNKSAKVKLKPNQEIVLNDGEDYAVMFNKLKAEFNKLNDKFNDLVTAYNSHIHTTTATVGATGVAGTIAPTSSSAEQSTADIDQTKVEKIRL